MKQKAHTRAKVLQVDDAWQVHRALVMAELHNPALAENPRWKLHRMDAYEDFHNLFTGAENGR